MQKRKVLNSPRLLELRRRRHQEFQYKILLCLAAILSLFSLFTYVSRIPSLNIDSIEISGNKVIEGEAIQAVVNENLTGHFLWAFPKTNIFFYPKNKIIARLRDNFSRLNDITFAVDRLQSAESTNVLKINVTEREAFYMWCGPIRKIPDVLEIEETAGESQCYFMDEDGFIFDEAPYFSGEVYFKFYGPAEESYFSPQNFEQLILFKNALENIKLKPIALDVEANGDARMFLSRETAPISPEIIFKTDSDFQKIAENLETALATEPLQSSFNNNYSNLLYLDLRFGNKVYYKFRP